ncbi:MAG: copper-binding protein [bacterium]|nr:copper-binding protein [Alphaproteobacteria bacterium]MDI1366351.1 copper-binding protein [bacterium]
MKNIAFVAIFAVLAVAGCGPQSKGSTSETASKATPEATAALPTYDSAGVISAVNGLILTIDHEGASAAQLPAGRNDFTGYADVLAEAPLTPGQRVTFKFRKAKAGLELAELKAR